jgi:uncharacterized protein (TIGR00290 family)
VRAARYGAWPAAAIVARPLELWMSDHRVRTVLSWSSGKDSAWSLHVLRQDPTVEVVGLLTTCNEAADRVAMHAVRRELLLRQADAVGLPVRIVNIPSPCTNEEYEARMQSAVDAMRAEGVEAVAFGDLFLEDIRAYREKMLAGTGLRPLFPLWGRPTATLAREMMAGGARAYVTCVDPRAVDPVGVLGAPWDAALLDRLPPTVCPCAENGEFHTFAVDGPAFRYPVAVTVGEHVERGGFHFADLLPA